MDFNGVAFGVAGLTAVLALVPVFLHAATGGVELIPGSTLFRRTLAQTQCADELLAGIFCRLSGDL